MNGVIWVVFRSRMAVSMARVVLRGGTKDVSNKGEHDSERL